MKHRQTRIGSYISVGKGGTAYKAYIPTPLPLDPPLDLLDMQELISEAHLAIGRLDSFVQILPSPKLFLKMYSHKEALLSSQIEGTQSSLSSVLEAQNSDNITDNLGSDDATVLCHEKAILYGIKGMEEIPISLRLLREVHSVLMKGQTKDTPGEFRRSQNWIMGSSPRNAQFVPPPHNQLLDHLDNFEEFLHHRKTNNVALIDAAIAHAQFETIHPFLDGNGRVGRLLIILMLINKQILTTPILYLSLYFKRNRSEYYRHLDLTRQTGDWEAWVKFFLRGVIETSTEALQSAKAIKQLFDEDEKALSQSTEPNSVFRVYKHIQHFPITTTKIVKEKCDMSLPTAISSLRRLARLGIAKEVSGKYSRKVFVYGKYIEIVDQGTEPLPP